MSKDLIVIRPEVVAGKLAAAANLSQPELAEEIAKQPRLTELLWFLQWQSMQPGGLQKFALDLIGQFSNCVGPTLLIKTAPAKLTPEQCDGIWRSLPESSREDIIPKDAWWVKNLHEDVFDEHPLPSEKQKLASIIAKLNRQAFVDVSMTAAREHLGPYLASLCNEPCRLATFPYEDGASTFNAPPWYFEEIIPTLFAAMDAHAERVNKDIVMTEVALKVFDGMEYASLRNGLARITGSSRFGKTEAVKAWCNGHPGKARLVSTPCSNRDIDLYRAVADALGLEYDYRTPHDKLKETVEYVIKHSALMFVFDEAHFLFPARFNKNTVPMRLNWVRTQMVDRKNPVVLVTTPQSYDHAREKFLKTSGYNDAQWSGRIVRRIQLPEQLEYNDLLAIVQMKCPKLDRDMQDLVLAKAFQTLTYIVAVESIGNLAQYIADRDGHAAVTCDDVELAAAEVLSDIELVPVVAPARQPAVKPAAALESPKPRQNRGGHHRQSGRPAAPEVLPPPAPALENPGREIKPALVTP